MNRIFSITLICIGLFLVACNGQQSSTEQTQSNPTEKEKPADSNKMNVSAEDITVLDFASFEPILSSKSDTTYIINFWATWCKPCVEELPYFEAYHEKYKDGPTKMILVSMDFPKQIEKKLVPFINDRNLQPEVLVLDAPDPNSWIDKVDPEWSGAIPITIIFKNDKRGFFEQSFHSLEELEETVAEVVK